MNTEKMTDIFEVLGKLEKQSSLEKSREVDVPSDERMLAITKETGELLNMLIRMKNAKNWNVSRVFYNMVC